MMKTTFDKKFIWIIMAIFVLSMLMATIYDLNFTKWIYDPGNIFGFFLWRYSELPVALVALFSLALVSVEFKTNGNRIQNLFKKALPFLILIVGGIMGAQLGSYYDSGQDIWIVMGLLTGYLMFGIAKKLDENLRERLYTLALRIVIVYAGAIIFPNILKVLWGRPRYRIIVADNMAFSPWYLPQGVTLINDNLKSFPSGHSAVAAVSLLSIYLPNYFESLKDKTKILFAFAIMWTLTVMISRIILGHHFLSDTLFGAGITIALIMVVDKYLPDSPESK